MRAQLLRIPVIEQFNPSFAMWFELIKLDPLNIKREECKSKAIGIMQEILSTDSFHLVRESDGFAVIGDRRLGPIRIKWETKLEKNEAPPIEQQDSLP